jgi:hypothetical protein
MMLLHSADTLQLLGLKIRLISQSEMQRYPDSMLVVVYLLLGLQCSAFRAGMLR